MEEIQAALLFHVWYSEKITFYNADYVQKGQEFLEKMIKAAFEGVSFNPQVEIPAETIKGIEEKISYWLGDPDNDILYFVESIKIKSNKEEERSNKWTLNLVGRMEEDEEPILFRCRVRADPDLGIEFQVELLARRGSAPGIGPFI